LSIIGVIGVIGVREKRGSKGNNLTAPYSTPYGTPYAPRQHPHRGRAQPARSVPRTASCVLAEQGEIHSHGRNAPSSVTPSFFTTVNQGSVILFAMSRPRTFPDNRLVENHPKLDIDALHRAGALHAGEISRWACQWLTVKIEAAEGWIVIDGDQRI